MNINKTTLAGQLSVLTLTLTALTALILSGCDRGSPSSASGDAVVASVAHKHNKPAESCFICDPALRDKGRLWCEEHGRYEDRCWLCHPELEDKDRPYCKEHFLYEDECHLCHPELKQVSPSAEGPKSDASNVAVAQCAAHGVDKAACFICDPVLRDKGRLWCKEHGRYEDRCWLCHPELEDKDRPYCKEHFLYEDECFICNPSLRSEKPKPSAATSRATQRPATVLFCKEHGVPEAECGICQPGRATSLRAGESMKIRFASRQSTTKAGVATVQPVVTNSAPTVRAYCEIRYNENNVARITPQAPGIVRRVLVNVGSVVKAGDVLADLDSPDLAKAKSEYLAKLQAAELAKIDLDRSQVIHDNTRKALGLCEGELSVEELEELSELDLGLNRRDLLTAHAQFEVAKSAYEREKMLLDQNIGSKADFQAAEAAYRKAWAEQLAVRDDLAFSSKRDLEAKTRAHKSARFDLESVKRQLLTLGLSETQVTEVPTQADAELACQYMRAPFVGTVIDRTAGIGEAVEPGQAVVTMADLSTMWLVLSIPADQAALVRPGMSVSATLPDLPGPAVQGKLVWVDSAVDERSRMVKARAEIPNPDGRLKAGMFGEAHVVVAEATQAVRVPRNAIQQYEKQPYVFVKLDDDLYALRRVAVGTKTNGTVDIIEGLSPDEPVVVAGSFTVLSEFLKSRLGAGCVDD